ncbi:MAG: hypothetical protein BWX71_01277 [Deltaproteobacteria bacterium ADurb.Bin072]|nr:MAG: hypothetical protein BWX71_01277 [Deltaproteobacteria bacterium ADurb.Bin072]
MRPYPLSLISRVETMTAFEPSSDLICANASFMDTAV